MDASFWLQHWREGRIGFHRDQPLPLLLKYWPTLALPASSRVLVPLCGKSLDMIWLASQGYRVLGVELSPLAVAQFLAENHLDAKVHDSPLGHHHVTDRIEIIQGDAFGLDDTTLATCDAIYDRAAVVALPAAMRRTYAKRVYARLRPGARGLMVTLEYAQREMDGPPFSVDASEVDALLGEHFEIDALDHRGILASEPGFAARGLTALSTGIYGLRRRAH